MLQDVSANAPCPLADALARYPSGVVALSAIIDTEPVTLLASSFAVGVSEEPPLALVAVEHSSTSWPLLRTATTFGVSVLGESHTSLVRQLASRSNENQLAGVKTITRDNGDIFISDAALWLSCGKYLEITCGDHDVVILRIEDFTAHDTDPLLLHVSQPR